MIESLKAYNIIEDALQNAGVVSFGDGIDANIAARALRELNAIRREWSLGNMGWVKYDQVFSPSVNVDHFTLGTGGDVAERPAIIQQVSVIYGQNNWVRPVLTYDEYRQLTFVATYTLPSAFYLKEGYPTMSLYSYPGIAAGYSVRVIGKGYMPDYATTSDAILDPPEYYQACVAVLALRMAQVLGFPIDTLLGAVGAATKNIKTKMAAESVPHEHDGRQTFNLFAGI
jgi:hypothetical protein